MLNSLFTHWQEIVVAVCVLSAMGFLLRNGLITAKKNSSCGGCNDCDEKNKSCDTH